MTYARPADRAGALRLHLNENTGGCSQAVIDAIRALSAEDAAYYPDYALLSRECAAYLGVSEAQLVLTNGLDEGLLALTVSAFRTMHPAGGVPEAIIPTPAFEMYSVFVKAAGGHVVPVPPRPDFAFQLEEVCSAISDRTRIIFLTSPNNPTGQLIPRDAIREIVRRVPPDVIVVIDEAYYDFCGETFLAELGAHSNVVIGRTFAKAHGLAGLRAGCLIGDPGGSSRCARPFRRIASASLPRRDGAPHCGIASTCSGIARRCRNRANCSMRACDRLGLPYWKSAGNFVLIKVERAGEPADIVRAFAERGILVRDRSRDAGCGGCIRITAGVARHTEIAVEALEDLCAVP